MFALGGLELIIILVIQLAILGLLLWAMWVFHKKNKVEIQVIRKRLGLGQDIDARGDK